MTPTPRAARRIDLDWIRILAFASLILYHVGMYYVTWGWHVKSPDASHAAEPLMMLANPWRLSLLFLVSGAATAFVAARMSPRELAGSRGWRLLPPLLFAIVFLIPPQSYFEVVEKAGYAGSYLDFWKRYLLFDGSFFRGTTPPPSEALRMIQRTIYAADQWAFIVAACGFAHRHLHRDGPARRYLTDAIFPFYIVHQTAIILCAVWLRGLALPAPAKPWC